MATMCPSCIEDRKEAEREFVAENKEWLQLRALFEQRFNGERGTKRLEENGVVMERRFRKQRSNAGENLVWLMDFHVTRDGKTEVFSDPNGPNRRSDPDRN
jgi:hypothetical protein